MRLIALAGRARSGKDTVYNMINWLCHNDHLLKTRGAGSAISFEQFMNWYRSSISEGCAVEQINLFEDKGAVEPLLLRFENVKYSRKLKEMLATLLSVDPDYLDTDEFKKNKVLGGKTGRHLMETLGTSWGRSLIHPDVWVDAAFMGYDDDHWIMTDTRFRNEMEAVRSRGGIVVRILNPKADSVPLRISEKELVGMHDDYFDHILVNNSTLTSLAGQVNDMLKRFKIL